MRHRLIIIMISAITIGLTGCAGINHEEMNSSFSQEAIDQYLNLVWIPEEPTLLDKPPFSFSITQFDGEVIEGRLRFDEIATPEVLTYYTDAPRHSIIFRGEVDGQTATCEFTTKDGYDGTLDIAFSDNEQIQASISFMETEEPFLDSISDTLAFKPYNLADLCWAVPERESSMLIELDFWGEVYLVKEENDTGRFRYSTAFLTDMSNNIVYAFLPGVSAFEIVHMETADINGDGLKEISFLSRAVYYHEDSVPPRREEFDGPDDPEVERVYYQGRHRDGSFVLNE